MNNFEVLNKGQLKQNIKMDREIIELKQENAAAKREVHRLNKELYRLTIDFERLEQINHDLKNDLFALRLNFKSPAI